MERLPHRPPPPRHHRAVWNEQPEFCFLWFTEVLRLSGPRTPLKLLRITENPKEPLRSWVISITFYCIIN